MIKLLAVWRYFCVLLLSVLLFACAKTPSGGHASAESASADVPAAASADVPADASAASADASVEVATDNRLGTQWGDEMSSKLTIVDLERVSDVLDSVDVFYSAKESGKKVNSIALLSGQIQMSVIDDRGRALPTFRKGNSYYIQGTSGQSYRLKYTNSSKKTYEVVASVDGLDVLTGTSASQYDNGYVLEPKGTLIIEGFRKDENTVASFTFSAPEASYANHNDQGDINNTGVIGTALFELQAPARKFAPPPNSQPNDRPKSFPADS